MNLRNLRCLLAAAALASTALPSLAATCSKLDYPRSALHNLERKNAAQGDVFALQQLGGLKP